MKYTIGIDMGGTNIVAGLVNENGVLLDTVQKKHVLPARLKSTPEIWQIWEENWQRKTAYHGMTFSGWGQGRLGR